MKRRKKILLGAAALLVVIIFASIVHHYRLKAAVERYRAELKAKGELLELAQLVSPAVPAERNGAELFLKAEKLLEQYRTFLSSNNVPAMQMVSPGKAILSATQPEARYFGQFGYTNSWAEVRAALEQEKETLENLRQLLTKPEVDFHIPYHLGFIDSGFFTNSHLVYFKSAAYLLRGSAVYDLRIGDTASAVRDTRASLVLGNAIRSQRTAISELVGIAVTAIAQTATWEILQATNVTDVQLAALQADWERLEFLQSYQASLSLERAVSEMDLRRMRASTAELRKLTDMYNKAYQMMHGDEEEETGLLRWFRGKWEIFQWQYWWSYADELQAMKGSAVLRTSVGQAKATDACLPAYRQQVSRLDELGIRGHNDIMAGIFNTKAHLRSLGAESIASLSPAFKKVMVAESSKRLTVTAIALKRFQLKHGNLPEKLSDLTPEFLPTVPRDPVDGQPLRYRRNADGSFLLYSIGEDGKDDGGDARPPGDSKSLSWQNGRDWVWPQPATPQEVEAFFATPGK